MLKKQLPVLPKLNSNTLGALCALLIALGSSLANAQDAVKDNPPNLIIILADDLGYGDVGTYGGKRISTPNIDQMANRGVKFTQGYVSHPVCSPSRAGLMTGRYQARHGWEFNPAGRDHLTGLDEAEQTMADRLKAQGYATGIVGKWHLGRQTKYHPMNRGFDEFFGVLQGASTFIPPDTPGAEYATLSLGYAPPTANNRYRGFNKVNVEEYLTDAFTDEATDFIARHAHKPFFLYLAHTTPHTPLQATKEYLLPYQHIVDKPTRIYSAMVGSLDKSVGRVMQALQAADLMDNTLVVFASDNGCAGYVAGACSNAPLRGFKRYHHEGGIRIPFIVQWPDGLPANLVYDAPVSALDLMATFLAAAGKSVEMQDSVNLLPYLQGKRKDVPHEYLHWRSGPTVAITDGRWKLIRLNKTDLKLAALDPVKRRLSPPPAGWSVDSPLGQTTFLYDLDNDIDESVNLAAAHPEIVHRLAKELDGWLDGIGDVEPLLSPMRSTLVEIDGQIYQLLI